MPGKAANAAARRWLERMGLADRAKSKLEELSHGNQQRVQLATALVHDPGAARPRRAVLRSRPDRHRDDDRGHPRAGRGRRRGRLLEPPARPRRGRLRGRRDHRPRPDRRLGRHRGAQDARRAASISRSRSSAPDGAWLDGARRRCTVLERAGDRVKLLVDRSVDLDALLARAEAAGEVRTFAYQPPKLSELFMEAVAPDDADRRRWRDAPLAERLAGRPARDPRARPQPRLHPQRAVHDADRRSARSSSRPSCSATRPGDQDRHRRAGTGRPSPATIERPPQRFDQKVAITTYPDAAAADAALADGHGRRRRRGAGRPVRRRARSGSRRRPTRRIAQIISAATIALRVAGRARPERRRPGGAGRRAAAAGGRRPRPADRGRPGALPVRQHRRGADPRRHLQLRLHGPDRRRRGEAEPGRRGRPLDRPRPRPADGQGPGIGVLGIVQLVVFVVAALVAALVDRPARPCPRRRPARSPCWSSGSSSATCCTRPRSGSSARWRRGWRRPRTPRPRSRWSR